MVPGDWQNPTKQSAASTDMDGLDGESSGLALHGILLAWKKVVTRPVRATFDTEMPAASWRRVITGLALLWGASIICDYLAGMESGHASISVSFGSSVRLVVGFCIFVGIWDSVAKKFGGRGNLLYYAYAVSLVMTPFGIGTEIAQLIPPLAGVDVGGLIIVGLGIYEVYLLILATASAHRLSKGRAAVAFLAPFGVLALGILAASFIRVLFPGV